MNIQHIDNKFYITEVRENTLYYFNRLVLLKYDMKVKEVKALLTPYIDFGRSYKTYDGALEQLNIKIDLSKDVKKYK